MESDKRYIKKRLMKSLFNNKQAAIDLAVIAILTVIIFLLAGYFDVFEKLHDFLEKAPRGYEIDEIFITLNFLAFTFAIFSIRRWKELKINNALRQQTEEQLKKSEETHRSLLENIPDVTWTSDEHGHTIYISPNVEAVYGFTPEEIYTDGKRCWLDRIHPEDVGNLLEQYGLLFSEQKPFNLEYRIQHKNGNWLWVHDRASNTHEVNGVAYTDGIFTEITKRKHLEKERDRVFNLSVDLICIAGFDGGFRRINPSFMRVLGHTEEYLMSHPILETVHPDYHEELTNEIERLAMGESVFNFECRIFCADGSEKLFSWSAVPVIEEGVFYATGRDITEQEMMDEEQLRLSIEIDDHRQRLNSILTDIPCVVWETQINMSTRDTNPTFVSNYVEKVHGYTPEEWLSSPEFWFSTIHPEDREKVLSVYPKLFEDGRSRNEYRYITKDGRTIWCDNQIVVVKNEEDETVTLRGVTTDITKRKRAEEERRVIFEIIQGVITTSNLNELLKLVHHSIGKLFYAENCFVALHDPVTDLMHFEYWVDKFDSAPPPTLIGKGFSSYVLRTGKPLLLTRELKEQMYKRALVKSAGVESASWVGVPLRLSSQTIGVLALQHYEDDEAYTERDLEFLSTVGDQIALAIERKQAEEALRESEQKLSLHIRQTPLAVIEWNLKAEVMEWNSAAESIFGYDREEVLGRSITELLVPEQGRENVARVWSDLISQKGGQRVTRENVTKDGKTIICEWYNTPLNDKGMVIGVASMAQDITKRVEMEKDLERTRDEALESVKLKSEFLANMSHEIRTPMNGVIGMTSLLLDTDLTLEQRDFAETIQTSGESLLTIIDDILDFSKIEAGKLRFESIDFDLREAVENPVELLAQRANLKGLELASIVYNDVPTNLIGDPVRLRQVLTNLIGNGIKFTEHGEVSVHVKKQSESANHVMLRFEIKDTGIGISEQKQRRLFQAFMQADGSTTRKYGGTGLGLAISKQLVQMMGGDIGIESAPGKGSTFWFTANFKRQSDVAISHRIEKADLKTLSVLVVDDNETNRKIFVHHTQSLDMSPVEAESGEQALELLRDAANRGTPFDLVLLDLQMPEMDGIELARKIKADEKISNARLVLLPSFSQREIGEKALQAGVSAYLTKPVRQSQLYNCLSKVMANAPASSIKHPRIPTTQKVLNREIKLHDERNNAYRILVAEDNRINQKVALSILANLGYKADAVANGCEALEAVEREKYDLILMDCQMPVMDGYEATMEIRRRESEFSSHIPIIAMTAHVLEGEREKCLSIGMNDYLSKPVKPELLYQMLQRWLPLDDESQTVEDFSAVIPSNKLNDAGVVQHVD